MTAVRSEAIHTGEAEVWFEQRGTGPDVLLIAGLGDPLESWEPQLEGLAGRYRLTAFDNRGVGRTPLPDRPLTVATMADDAAALLQRLEIDQAHVAGFSAGSVIAQELAIRHPELVRSLVLVSTWARPDAYFRTMVESWGWMAESAPDERAFLEAFFLWVYTRRAHEQGTVERLIEETLAFPHKPAPEAMQRTMDAFLAHETADRLDAITAPTLVLAGRQDIQAPPRYGRAVAEGTPDARFEVLDEEAHQPFQEVPEEFNERVDAFWREVEDGRGDS